MSLKSNIEQIERLRKELSTLQPISAENKRKLDEKLRLEFHYNTNHIEGNTLTYGETKLILLFDEVVKNHKGREIEEMKASEVAYQYIEELAEDKERPLSERDLKELNRILLVRPFYKEATTADGQETRRLISIGDYKQHPNTVRLENGELFHYSSPAETPAQMTDLINWYREEEEKGERHPIELAALLHYRFVRIHPFDDGNGRISRLLVNYVLYKHDLPPVVVKTDDKTNYLRALHQADVGDLNAFVEYMSEQLIWSLELTIKATNGEDIEEVDDWKKKLDLLDRKLENNAELHDVKSPAVIGRILDDVIIPLFYKVYDELNLFDKLFIEKAFYVNASNGEIANIISKDDFLVISKHKDAFYNSVELGIRFMQFKKNGSNTFNIGDKVSIVFENTLYVIYVREKLSDATVPLLTKYYHEDIKEADRDIIIKQVAENLLAIIDEKTQSLL